MQDSYALKCFLLEALVFNSPFLIIREEAFDPTHRLLFFLSGLGNGLECFLNLEYGKPFA